MGIFDFLKQKNNSTRDEMADPGCGPMYKDNPQACSTDKIPQGSGEFGLDIKNPVPVREISGEEIYLSRLRTNNDEKITWKREGSTQTKEIWGCIDIYTIFVGEINKIATIYISPYHLKTSHKAPKGFKILVENYCLK